MAEGRTERRLAAILAADVVGYSRLIRADEEGTLDRLKALRNEIIDPKVAEHNGRIVICVVGCYGPAGTVSEPQQKTTSS